MQCLKCGSEAIVKNGHMKGLQRYKCKSCSYQFTQETPRGKPLKDKILALTLYLSGLSMNMTGQIVGVSTQSVMRWIKMFSAKYADIPLPQGTVEEVEIDEMHHYIGKKNIFSGSGKLLIITPESLSDGNVAIVVRKP
jgi:transposase-like protein